MTSTSLTPLFPEVQEVLDLGQQMVSSLKFWQKKASDQDLELQRERERFSSLSEKLSAAEERSRTLGQSIPTIQDSLNANLNMEKELESLRETVETSETSLSRERRERLADAERHERQLAFLDAERVGDIDAICDWYEEEKGRREEEHRGAETKVKEEMRIWADEQAESHAQIREEYEARVIKLEEELFGARKSAKQVKVVQQDGGGGAVVGAGQLARYESLIAELRSEIAELKKKVLESSTEDDFDDAGWGKSSKKKKVTFDLAEESGSADQQKPKRSLMFQQQIPPTPLSRLKERKLGSMGDVLGFNLPNQGGSSFSPSPFSTGSGLFGGQRSNAPMQLLPSSSSKAGQKRKLFTQSFMPNEKLF